MCGMQTSTLFVQYMCQSQIMCVSLELKQPCCRAGPLPVPEKWNEDLAKGAFDLEETDIGSSDQVKGN